MQDINSLISEMETEYNRKANIPKLPLLVFYINNIFLKIANCKDTEEANTYFDLLGRIHSIVSKIMFIDKFEVPPSCRQFFKDFDRIDTMEMRIHFFNEFKKGNYILPVGAPFGSLIKIYEDWQEHDDFYILFQVGLAFATQQKGSKLFSFEVVSSKRLEKIVNKSNIELGQGYIIMNDFDISLLEEKINHIISICTANNINETINNLSKFFRYKADNI